MTSTETRARGGYGYGALWKTVPREVFFLFAGLPVSAVGFGLIAGFVSAAFGTIATFFIGIAFFVAGLYIARGFGAFELLRLELAGQPAIPPPDWQSERARSGFWGWLRSLFGNGHYWMYLLHTGFVNFVVSTVTFSIAAAWLAIVVGGLSYWSWVGLIPSGDQDWHLSRWLFGVGSDYDLIDSILYLLLGLVFAAVLPYVTRGLTIAHYGIARGMLGSFRYDQLTEQVGQLQAARSAASSAEGHSLRRLERDIHDGPQQRLVRLQMDLAAADRQLDRDPARARELIGEAMAQSREALEELRALSRGFAPPILLDRGLVAALESLAVRSPVEVRIESGLPEDTTLPQEIERNAYFVASELLTNVTKHSGATLAVVRIGLRRPESAGAWLDVEVTDDGRGGAVPAEGHGLAGLEERLRGLGGLFELSSPVGGPTVATGRLPLSLG